jgi:hypothetical protein
LALYREWDPNNASAIATVSFVAFPLGKTTGEDRSNSRNRSAEYLHFVMCRFGGLEPYLQGSLLVGSGHIPAAAARLECYRQLGSEFV